MINKQKPINILNILLFTALVLSVCLLVYQGSFNVMRLDDFDFGLYLNTLNRNEFTFNELIESNINNVMWMRENWQGTYFALFIMKLSPLYFGRHLGSLSTLILISSVVIANIYYGKICCNLFSTNRTCVISIVLMLSLFQINCMPFPEEGIFWWNAGALYLFSYLYISIVLYALITFNKFRIIKLLTITFFVFATEGSGWPCATLLVVILFFINVYAFSTNHKNKYIYLYSFIIACAFLFYAFSAPGNFVRKSLEVGVSMPVALIESFVYSIVHLFVYFNSSTLAILLVFAFVLLKFADFDKIKYLGKKRCLFAYWCCYSSMFAPAIYGENYVAAPRYLNILFLMHIIFCFLVITFIVVNYKLNLNIFYPRLSVLLLSFIYLSGFFNNTYADPASMTVILDTINGTNTSFKKVMDNNFDLLESNDKEVTLTLPVKRPRLFINEGFNYDWVNDDIKEYYNKDLILFE